MTRLRLPALLAACALVAVGCDSALDPEPTGIETIENQLSSASGAAPFVAGFYQPLTGLYGSFGAPFVTILESGTDDGWPFAQFAGGFKERDVTGGEGELNAIWGNSLGNGVGRINLYLETEPDIDFTGEEGLQGQFRGEALFMRAFYYFNLVRLFGEVPIYTEATRTVGEAQKARSPVPDVYEQIKSDLRQAIDLLPESYNDSGLGQERGRATSGAARTLLAKVHLTLEEWQDVLDVTAPLASQYSLRPNYIDNFYGLVQNTAGENRVEAIFEVQFAEDRQGPQSQIRVSYSPRDVRDGQNQILPTDDNYLRTQSGAYGPNAFVGTFEDGDARFGVTLSRFGDSRGTVTEIYPLRGEDGEPVFEGDDLVTRREYFVQKWYSDVANTETRWNLPVFRYAEVLLMRAEAYAETGQTEPAIGLLNQIRTRAGLDNLAADIDDQGEVREAVRHERRVEFGFEFKRFYDLNRWGILPAALAPQGITISPAKITAHPITGKPQVLYPIPQSELQRNPNATQNAGY